MVRALQSRHLTPYWFVLPGAFLLVVVMGFPLLQVATTSLRTDSRAGLSDSWTVDNYGRIASDPLFWNAARNTVVFTLGSIALHALVGLGAALVLNQRLAARRLWRMLLLLPWTIPGVVAALNWKWLFDPQLGLLTNWAYSHGIASHDFGWLGDPGFAMPAVIFSHGWRGFPFVMVMLLAGLQTIPREQYDAAAVDGASEWRKFVHVTLPNLRGIFLITLALDAIWTARYFDLIFVMTAGGPASMTEVLPMLIYKAAFQQLRFGYAATIAVVMTLFLLALVVVSMRLNRRPAS